MNNSQHGYLLFRNSVGAKILDKRLKNLGWNFVSGVFSGAAIVGATSIMVRQFGYEKFGVISIWIVLQGLLQLFDYGIGPILVREIAKRNLPDNHLLAAASTFYKANSLVLGAGLSLLLYFFLPSDGSRQSAWILVCISLAIQLYSVFLSSVLLGNGNHRGAAKAQIIGNSLRYGGGAALAFFIHNLEVFFAYQIFASLAANLTVGYLYRHHFPRVARLGFREVTAIFLPLASHSGWMWLTSAVSASLSIADRALVALHGGEGDVGRYATAFVAAGLLNLFVLPYYRVYYPEYSSCHFGDKARLLDLFYGSCSQLALLLVAVGLGAFFIAEPLFLLWLGNYDNSQILTFYCLLVGLGLCGVMWLPGALCQALGRPSLHVYMLVLALPTGVTAAFYLMNIIGYIAGACIWVVHGIIGLSVELYLIKRHVLDFSLTEWYRRVLLKPISILAAGITIHIIVNL